MTGGAYRDETTGLTARLEGLRDDVHRSETRFPPRAWKFLPEPTSAALAALRAAVPREAPTSMEEALVLESALEAYRGRLEAAIDAARDIEPNVGRAPNSAPELTPRHAFGAVARLAFDLGEATERLGFRSWRQRIREAIAAFDAIVMRSFPEARLDTPSASSRRAFFHAYEAPICLFVEIPPFRGGGSDGVELRAGTHIALAVPRVRLRPETIGGVDVRVGDEAFDGLFDVDALLDEARQVLVPGVRTALVRLAWHDVPTVAIGDGHAEIAWTYQPTRDAIDDASRALAALRKLAIEARLLEW